MDLRFGAVLFVESALVPAVLGMKGHGYMITKCKHRQFVIKSINHLMCCICVKLSTALAFSNTGTRAFMMFGLTMGLHSPSCFFPICLLMLPVFSVFINPFSKVTGTLG